MARKKIVAGNWKMNKTLTEARSLVEEVLKNNPADNKVCKIIFPPFLFLSELNVLLTGREDVFTGAQNCHTLDAGAYTGETSAQAIASVGASYVLVGHSERRQYFHENSEVLKSKLDAVYRNGLIPVYCIGEVLAERKQSVHFQVVARQLADVCAHISPEHAARLILAYEPVWAIGTGETATPQQAEEMHAFIRKELKQLHGERMAEQCQILYGGSCNASNAAELFACPNVDGGLIGGASLKVEDFTAIIQAACSVPV